jgi:hypothetical protein
VLLDAEQNENTAYENLAEMKRKIASLFNWMSYKKWQEKYSDILSVRANGITDNSAETYLFINGLNLTEMATDPLM